MAQAQHKESFFSKLSSDWKSKRFEKKYGKQIFLIYSMGKVGSSTIKASFERSFPYLPAFQIHFLSDYWLKEKLLSMPVYFQVHIKWAEQFFKFRKEHSDARLKIITLVREPVIRDISDIFENGKEYFNTSDIEKVSEETILNKLEEHDYAYTLDWFDTEFKAWTGIDIYQQPFDREKGYSCWKLKDFDILCIKLEKLDEVMEEAMLELSGFPFGISANANISENKPGKQIYKRVVEKFRLPPDKADRVYSSKLMKHFYSNEEIAKYRTKWEKR